MYGEGKFFFIRSNLNGLVLDIEGGDAYPGAQVIMYDFNDQDNQLWYSDEEHGVLRSKLDDRMVLHNEGGCLTIQLFQPGEYNQQWQVSGDVIRHRQNGDRVLDIAENNIQPGARICAWDYHGGANQTWQIIHVSPKRCYIASQMHGKVLDVEGCDTSSGTRAVMYEKQDPMQDNQLWWEDRYGVIHSCLNDMAIDVQDCLRMEVYSVENPSMQWVLAGDRICRRGDLNTVLDIKGAKHKNCAKVISYTFSGDDNQLWSFDYVD